MFGYEVGIIKVIWYLIWSNLITHARSCQSHYQLTDRTVMCCKNDLKPRPITIQTKRVIDKLRAILYRLAHFRISLDVDLIKGYRL